MGLLAAVEMSVESVWPLASVDRGEVSGSAGIPAKTKLIWLKGNVRLV